MTTNMKLTEHFTLAELTASHEAEKLGIDNSAPPEIVPRLVLVAEMLERVRSALDAPITVSSGYRCAALNEAVGGAPGSDHPQGHAADIEAPAFGSATEVANALAPQISVLGIGQIILERLHSKQWVHLSTHAPEKPINRVITITDAGPVPGIIGLA